MKLLLAIFVVVGFLVLGWAEREPQEPPAPPYPERVIPVGTNSLPIGTQLFALMTRSYRGQVQKVEQEHQFSGGEVAPAVLIRRDTMSLWVRRTHLGNSVIAAE